MRKSSVRSLLIVSLVLATAFIFGCSSDTSGGGGGGRSSGGKSSIFFCGETYELVEIGEQTWFNRNSNCDPNIYDGIAMYYEDDSAKYVKYGRLYNSHAGYAACPPGFDIPTLDEWEELMNFVRKDKGYDYYNSYYDGGGKHLKATSGWDNYEDDNGELKSGNGLDSYGFSALPGGRGDFGLFDGVGNYGGWWVRTRVSHGGTESWQYYMSMTSADGLFSGVYDAPELLSVRCLKGTD